MDRPLSQPTATLPQTALDGNVAHTNTLDRVIRVIDEHFMKTCRRPWQQRRQEAGKERTRTRGNHGGRKSTFSDISRRKTPLVVAAHLRAFTFKLLHEWKGA